MHTAPLWETVRDELLSRISAGTFDPGERLPTEKALCAQFAVSNITIRRALTELSNMGIVDRRQGSGTYVRDSKTIEASASESSALNVGIVFPYDRASTPDELSSFHFSIFSGIQAELSDRGGNVHILSVPQGSRNLDGILPRIREMRIGSLVLMGMFSSGAIKAAESLTLRCVEVDHAAEPSSLDSVVLDHADGARQVTELLWSLGHRRIGAVRARKNNPDELKQLIESTGSRDRYAGYAAALESFGAEPTSMLEVWGELGEYDWVTEIDSLLSRADRPTALMLTDLYFLPETVRIAADRGLRVPQDLSLVSFGTTGQLRGFRPEPTIATFDPATMAAAVLDRLMAAAPQGSRVIRKVPMRLDPGGTIAMAPTSEIAGEAK